MTIRELRRGIAASVVLKREYNNRETGHNAYNTADLISRGAGNPSLYQPLQNGMPQVQKYLDELRRVVDPHTDEGYHVLKVVETIGKESDTIIKSMKKAKNKASVIEQHRQNVETIQAKSKALADYLAIRIP
jgi:hypothetical protein